MGETLTVLDLDQLSTVADGLDHPEGLCIDPAGVLYAGGEGGQIYRVDLGAATVDEVASTGGFVLGLCADGDGLLYACDLRRSEVLRIDPATGAVEVLSSGTADRPMHTPNWPVFDDAGNLYVTDSGEWKRSNGRVYRIDPDGRTVVWSDAAHEFPNGACLSVDGRSLLVVESLTPALAAVAIEPDGSAGARTVIASLPSSVPDGVTLAADGTAFVTCYRPDRVYRIAPGGQVEVFADDPQGTVLAAPTNGAFVGAGLGRLVFANLGRWHLTGCAPGVAGLPLRYPTRGGGR